MYSSLLALSMLVLLAGPAGAVITDQEPANDTVATAPIVMIKTGPVTISGGELELVAGDIDFLGIPGLLAGDVITVSVTPLEDPPDLEVPDTIVGLFDSSTTDPTTMILCRGDDAFNNDLDQFPTGFGSLCRFEVSSAGDYYVGVTGFRPHTPPTCDPGVPPGCTSFPFDGGIGTTPCEEPGPTFTCGSYEVSITVNTAPPATPTATPTPTPTPTPEPGGLLQLVSGTLGLAALHRRRSRNRVRAPRA